MDTLPASGDATQQATGQNKVQGLMESKADIAGGFKICKAWNHGSFTIAALPATDNETEVTGTSKSDGIILTQQGYRVEGGFGNCRAKTVIFSPGDFSFYQAGIYHHSVSKYRGSALAIEFDHSLRRQISKELNPRVNLDEPRTATSGLKNGFAHQIMLSEFLKSDWDAGPLKAQCLLTLLMSDMCSTLAELPDASSTRSLDARSVARLTEYIDTHVDEKIHIHHLAAMVGVSQFHFARLFKETTGLPPHQFILRHRIEKVKDLLGHPKMSLAEISYCAGFSSQSHMSTQFKKLVGMSPNLYRKTAFC